jgi:hypothetical protein
MEDKEMSCVGPCRRSEVRFKERRSKMHRKATVIALVLVGALAFCFTSIANADTTTVNLAQKTWIQGTVLNDEKAGWSLAYGDIDNSGRKDLVIGVPWYKEPAWWLSRAGGIYVFLGDGDLDTVSTSDYDYMIWGESDSSKFGWSVASNDLNNDGYEDIIVGAPAANNGAGKTYIIWGQELSSLPSGTKIELCCPEDPSKWPAGFKVTVIVGKSAGDSLGYAATSCNVNGDVNGIHDLVVSAPGAISDSGQVYVFFGGNPGTALDQYSYPSDTLVAPSGTTDVVIKGTTGDKIGYALDCSNVDNDEAYDIAIGAPYQGDGRAYVVFGQCNIPALIKLGTLPFGVAKIDAAGNDSLFGYSIANGDIDCDTLDDIVVGAWAYYASTPGDDNGRAYVFVGSSVKTWGGQGKNSGDAAFYVQGADDDMLGECVAVGMFNGGCEEGGCYEDLIVGAPGARVDTGSVFILFGEAGLSDDETEKIDLEFIGVGGPPPPIKGDGPAYMWTGCGLAIGDFDEDGAEDVAIGATREDHSGATDEGGVHVIYGDMTGPEGLDIVYPGMNALWCDSCHGDSIIWTEPTDDQGVDTMHYVVKLHGKLQDSVMVDTCGPDTMYGGVCATCPWKTTCMCWEDSVYVILTAYDFWGNCSKDTLWPLIIDTHKPGIDSISHPDSCTTYLCGTEDSVIFWITDGEVTPKYVVIEQKIGVEGAWENIEGDDTLAYSWGKNKATFTWPSCTTYVSPCSIRVTAYDSCDHDSVLMKGIFHIKPCHLNISSVDLPHRPLGVENDIVICDECYTIIWHIDCEGAGLSDTAITKIALQTNCWDQNFYTIDEYVAAKCTTYGSFCPGTVVGDDFCCDSVRLMVVIEDTIDQIDTTYSEWFMIDCWDPHVSLITPDPPETLCTGNTYEYDFYWCAYDYESAHQCSCQNNSGIDHTILQIYAGADTFVDTTFDYSPACPCTACQSYSYKFPGVDSVVDVTLKLTTYDCIGNMGFGTWTLTLLPYTVGPAWSDSTVKIDGTINTAEWADAWRWGKGPCSSGLPIGDIFGRIGAPDDLCDVYLTVKNDGEFLYVAVWAPEDETRSDGDFIRLWVDENQDTVWSDTEGYYYVTLQSPWQDTIFWAKHHTQNYQIIDPTASGKRSYSRSLKYDGYMHWEFRIPITDCEGFTPEHGIHVTPGCPDGEDHVGLFIQYNDAEGAIGNHGIGWWPQCGPFGTAPDTLYAPSHPHYFGKLEFAWRDVEVVIEEPDSCDWVDTWEYCQDSTKVQVRIINRGQIAYCVPIEVRLDTLGGVLDSVFADVIDVLGPCEDTLLEFWWFPGYAGYDYEIYAEVDVDDGCPGNNTDMVIAHTYLHDALVYEILPITNVHSYQFCSGDTPVESWFIEPCDTAYPQAVIYNNGNVDEDTIPVIMTIVGSPDWEDTAYAYDVAVGEYDTVTFDEWIASCCIGHEYSIEACTDLPCEYNAENDCESESTTVLVWTAYSDSAEWAPSIDGVIGPDEWEDAYTLDVTDVFGIPDGHEDSCGCVTAYFKNSGDYLYVAVTWTTLCANCCVDICDAVYLYFDDDNNNAWPSPGDRSEGYYTAVYLAGGAQLLYTDFRIAQTDTLSDALVAFGPPTCGDCPEVVEFAIPIGTWDEALNVDITGKQDTVGMHVRVFDQTCGEGQKDIGWWASKVDKQKTCAGVVTQFSKVPRAWGHLILHSGAVTCFEIPMVSICGWHMVSLPVMPTNKSVDVVFPGHCGVFTWDGDGYIEPDSVEEGLAYWVCYIEPCTITVCGVPVTEYTRSLAAGWSMIGAVYQTVDFTDPDDDPDGSIIDNSLFLFEPTTCQYGEATTLDPTWGYWVAADQVCDLTVSVTTTKMTTSPSVGYGIHSAPMNWSCDLQVKNNDSAPINLKIGTADNTENLDRLLPPPSPGTKFDAWLKGTGTPFDRLATDVRGTEPTNTWTVMVKSNAEFTLSWDKAALPEHYNFLLRVNGEEIDMREEDSYSIKSANGNVMSFEVVVTELPKVFAVSQNSPNPFAEATEIRFQLPKQSHVNIGIYSITGQKVAELVDKDMKAGYHTVSWDARGDTGSKIGAGIYFYVIQTEEFRSVKKMTLLR